MIIRNSISYLYIAIGGGLGAVLRVLISSILTNSGFGFIYQNQFPLPILLINLLGCFLMGVSAELMGVYLPASYNLRLFIVSGLLGGFTTFSTFSLEFGLMWQKNLIALALTYALLSLIFSVIAFFLGVKVIKLLF